MHISALASLIKFEGDANPIRVFHASLQDFLLNEERSRGFYIKQTAVFTFLSRAFLYRVPDPGMYLAQFVIFRVHNYQYQSQNI